ncbi:hypothetical protein KUV89_03995 [Marinobacter hydrocarbonoclasticus]|nr:hypothetical protein [Marinobacter nauticus]
MKKIALSTLAVLIASGCSSDKSDTQTLSLSFDAETSASPYAESDYRQFLLRDDYQLEVNGQVATHVGEFSLDDTVTLSVRSGDVVRVVHSELDESVRQAFSEFYSLEGALTVEGQEQQVTLPMFNTSFTLVAIDDRPELSHVALNDDLLAPAEGDYRHGFVTGFNYTLIGVGEGVDGANKQSTNPDNVHLYQFNDEAEAWSMMVISMAHQNLPFSYRNLKVLDQQNGQYRAVVEAGDSELFARVPGLPISEVDIAISVTAEGESRGYTNLYLKEAGTARCATILASGDVHLYGTGSCTNDQDKEVFSSYDELRQVYPTLTFNGRYVEPLRGFQNVFHRLADANEGELVEIDFRLNSVELGNCDHFRVDNGVCVGSRVSTADHSQRMTVGAQLVDGMKLVDLPEPHVEFSRGGDNAFINFYCKKPLVGVRTIAYPLSEDWASFTQRVENRTCELGTYRGIESFGSQANLRTGSTTAEDHDAILEAFQFRMPKAD